SQRTTAHRTDPTVWDPHRGNCSRLPGRVRTVKEVYPLTLPRPSVPVLTHTRSVVVSVGGSRADRPLTSLGDPPGSLPAPATLPGRPRDRNSGCPGCIAPPGASLLGGLPPPSLVARGSGRFVRCPAGREKVTRPPRRTQINVHHYPLCAE